MGRSRTSAKAGVLFFGKTSTPLWTKILAAVLAAAVVATVPTDRVRAVSGERETSALRAAQWVVARQEANGAFFNPTQSAHQTAETLAAIIAGGASGDPVARALDYISANGQAAATKGAFTGRIIAGVVAAGEDPRAFGGVDYVAILDSQYDASTGAYDASNFFANLLGANGAVAANGGLPAQAVAYLRANECAAGGFGFSNGCGEADTDTTALAVSVLVAAGFGSDPIVARARTFLSTRQNDDGGFGFAASFPPTSADSTGFGLVVIAALGEEAQAHPWLQVDGDDPVRALLALQDPSGGFKFSPADTEANAFSTVNAIPGMAGRPFPIHPAIPPPPPPPPPAPSATPDPSAPDPDVVPPPDTFLSSRDLERTSDRSPTFQFAANKVLVRFECSLDGGDFVPCASPFTTRRLRRGPHSFAVRAIDADDRIDATPASDGFVVVQRRRRR